MDPLLSTLCNICFIDPPKYTCPRCLAQTCSLHCSKRHKVRASCNGVRDPTVFRPISEIATASGIDHDYNFLHSIETRIQRSEKVLVEDLGIVSAAELKRAREGGGEPERNPKRRFNELPGEAQISRVLQTYRITVAKAPKGMRRNQENTTSWAKNAKDVNWQVEWVRDSPSGRTLYRALGNRPIGDTYDLLCEEERKMAMTPEEKRLEKKRKTAFRMKDAKRLRLDVEGVDVSTVPLLQNPESTAWDVLQAPILSEEEIITPLPRERDYNLYVLRTGTPASFPKVLKPIDPSTPLIEVLSNRTVLEFPTIHVLSQKPEDLPPSFMLEKAFLAATGHPQTDTEMGSPDEESEVSDDTSSDGSSSSSSEDEDSDAEDGEIVED